MKLGCVLFDLLLYVDVPALVMEQFDRAAVFGCAAIVQAPQWMKHRWDEWLSRRRAFLRPLHLYQVGGKDPINQ